MSVHVPDEAATEALARALALVLEPGDTIVLEGGLGAGKTTFVRAVLRGLGLPEDEPVTSPTFAIVQEYPTSPPVLHADLYRLSHSDELREVGLDERVGRDVVAFIEWGEAHEDALPHVDLIVRIESDGADARSFDTDARTPRGARLASVLRRASA